MMQVSGIIKELDLTQRERTIKIHVEGVAKTIWVNPTEQDDVKKLELGQQVTFEVREGRDYYFYQSHVVGERTSANIQNDTSPQTESETRKPPQTTENVFGKIIHGVERASPYTPTKDKNLPPTPGKGRACSARFMAKFRENLKSGKTPEEIADEYCFSVQEVYQNRAALEVKERIEEKVTHVTKPFDTGFDTIRPGHYVRIARIPDPDRQFELAKKVAEENLSVRELEKEIKGPTPPEPPREEATDTGAWTCPVCKERFHLLHHPNGRHEFEKVEVVEK
jgi:hypothetical protein